MTPEPTSMTAKHYPLPGSLRAPGSTSAFDPDRPSHRPGAPFVRLAGRTSEYGYLSRYNTRDDCDPPLTNNLTVTLGPRELFVAEAADKARRTRVLHQTYRARIRELRGHAELDGLEINQASENDFWSFVTSEPFGGRAEVVLVDNGDLRAIWDDEHGSHVGLEFLGDRMLQYVIFRRRKGTRHISRVAGRDDFYGVKGQLRTFEIEPLLQP